MKRRTHISVRLLAGAALLALAGPGAPRAALAQLCDPQTGSPPAELLLGPNGEQFYPENDSCPDRVVAPECKNGSVLTWVDPQDPNALTRYACVSSPAGAQNLPLVVFLHGSRIPTVDLVFGGMGRRRARTDLQKRQDSADLGGATPGYVLLMPQGRCLEASGPATGDGVRFDVWHKDAAANLDIRAIRAFVQQVADRSTFDEQGNPVALPANLATFNAKRTYLMDWSVGGYMSHFMALAFPNEFAAVASFASASPYTRRPCPTPFPEGLARRPGFITVHAECDPVLACENVEEWIDSLTENGWSSADRVDLLTDSSKRQTRSAGCKERSRSERSSCPARAHTTYANSQLPAMFEFLKGYQLP